jgi:hypothetical protein
VRKRFVVSVWLGLAWAAGAWAGDSLRVGNQLLMVGDSAIHVRELLGKPSYRSHRGSRTRRRHRAGAVRGDAGGEHWQYRRDGHVIVVTIVDGVVADIDERAR